MDAPPSLSGGDHERCTTPGPPLADSPVGGSGAFSSAESVHCAKRFWVWPLILVKSPPAYSCVASAAVPQPPSALLIVGANGRSAPVVRSNAAIFERVCPSNEPVPLKCPPQ